MTRQEVINELTDIRAAIDADGELVAEDSLDALAARLMEEGSTDISEVELDTINAMIYDSFVDPETICVELINMLMSTVSTVEEDIDPFVDDIWDDLSDEEIAALTSDNGINWAEYPDHEFQEEVDDKSKDTEKLTEEDKAYEYQCSECGHTATLTDKEYDGMCPNCKDHHGAWSKVEEDLTEAHYGKDSIIAGDIPGKTNSFYSLLVMRFNNMGYDEVNCPLINGEYEWDWNPFGEDSLVMFGDSKEFFDPIVKYIESEVGREDSAWYNRDYEVVEVEGRRTNTKDFDQGHAGPWALCIEAREYDRIPDDLQEVPLPKQIAIEYARRRKMRKANDKTAA